MSLQPFEIIIKWLGGLLAYTALGVVLYGVWRGTRQTAGQTTGRFAWWLRSPLFYLVTTLLYIGAGILLWQPLPLELETGLHAWALGLGSLLYFPGMAFVLWGRLALSKNYFVSTGFGAQLFAGHQLVTNGPYSIIRHPMYLGLMLAALGGLLLYQTWTMVAFTIFAPFTLLRSRREERVLSAEFGAQWQEYCQRVPAFLPRLSKGRNL
jgi:protein-S-isoprenylcysteine O-methyltransferase Ste14